MTSAGLTCRSAAIAGNATLAIAVSSDAIASAVKIAAIAQRRRSVGRPSMTGAAAGFAASVSVDISENAPGWRRSAPPGRCTTDGGRSPEGPLHNAYAAGRTRKTSPRGQPGRAARTGSGRNGRFSRLQRDHDQDIDIARVQHNDALLEFGDAALKDDLVEIFSGREQVHSAILHDANDLKIAARTDRTGCLSRADHDWAHHVVVAVRLEDIGRMKHLDAVGHHAPAAA